MQPLLLALIGSGTQADAAQEALRAVARGQNNPEALAGQLAALADANRDLLALQLLATRMYLQTGRPDQAATLASRTAAAFPTAIEPAWLATEAMLAADQPDRALLFAREWRAKAPGQARQADMQIAAANLKLRNADAALAALKPYLADASRPPMTRTTPS